MFNNYEKWGAINMRPMRPIWGAYWGASEILPNMTYMIINHLKQSAAMSFEYITIYEKWGKIKHIPHLPHWGKQWGKKNQ